MTSQPLLVPAFAGANGVPRQHEQLVEPLRVAELSEVPRAARDDVVQEA